MRDYFKTPQHFKTCYLYLSNTDHCACISIMVLISKLSTEDCFRGVLLWNFYILQAENHVRNHVQAKNQLENIKKEIG